MNKINLISLIVLIALFSFSGCYTYLSLSDGAKLAETPYEPYFPQDDPCPPPPPPPCILCGEPNPRPEPIIVPYIPPSPPYERPEEMRKLRDGVEGRNSGNTERRR
jgi:hypothetical protein